MTDEREVEEIRAARERVLERIAAACLRVGRSEAGVTLVAVSKSVPAARLRAGVHAGLTVFGENRVQEAAGKVEEVPNATWHLIGPLQSNKARRAVALFDCVESVDSVEIARRLDGVVGELRRGLDRPPLPVYVQVNVDRDHSKAGLDPDGIDRALNEIGAFENLRLEGLMTVGRLVRDADEARPTFRALAVLSDRLRRTMPMLGAGLSMGMSDDFEVAIEEGATLVRVGRALFGERPPEG
jgi:pyridoxal phosphate enzyme (YggS family)